jgi:hypothetical protein
MAAFACVSLARWTQAKSLVLVFGIAKLREGRFAKAVPVNVTIIREGAGEFYGTQGDDKCISTKCAEPIVGIPHRSRSIASSPGFAPSLRGPSAAKAQY